MDIKIIKKVLMIFVTICILIMAFILDMLDLIEIFN